VATHNEQLVRDRIEDWRRRLIDLSYLRGVDLGDAFAVATDGVVAVGGQPRGTQEGREQCATLRSLSW
jgi:hypothetical protein